MKTPKKLVSIVIPLPDTSGFTGEEKISLRHLVHYLGKYDKYFIISKNQNINLPGFGVKKFATKYFGSVAAHSRLLLSPHFYETFSDYRYILIYHLDSLVFSDQLKEWCYTGYDYIGAPWIKQSQTPYEGNPNYENKVGNGGFSLRKISGFLEVLNSQRYSMDPVRYWNEKYQHATVWKKILNLPRYWLKHLRMFNGVNWEIKHLGYVAEERFWANRAIHYYPQFKIAPVDEALLFAFECAPRHCFERTDRTLPFGCHAWCKFDREFWKPFLLKGDNDLIAEAIRKSQKSREIFQE